MTLRHAAPLQALLATALLSTGCPKEVAEGPSELPTIVLVRGPAVHEWTPVPFGAEFVLEVELRLKDGSLAKAGDYAFAWGGPIDATVGWIGLTQRRETVAPGRERLTLSATGYNYIPGIGCRVQAVDRGTGMAVNAPNALGPFNVVFWGGTPAGVALPPGEVRLGVGEERPFVPLAGPVVEEGQVKGKPSHLPVTVTSSNPSVARVESDGVTLTGVAQGSATLTVRAGTVTEQVPVTVDARPLGPPTTVGFRAAAPRATGYSYFPIVTANAGAVQGDYLVAVDGRGYPYLTARVNFGLWLAGWTGTDAGWEPVSAPGEEVDEPGAVTVDGRGRLYVVYRTFGLQLVVAERAAAGRPSTWSRRPLFPVADLGASQDWLPTASDHGDVAVMPRQGGGVWVAYLREWKQAAGNDRCRTQIRLFEVTDAAIQGVEVAEAERAGACDTGSFQARWQQTTQLVGVRAGQSRPDLIVSGMPIAASGTGWSFPPTASLTPKPARPEDPAGMGWYLPADALNAGLLPADAPRLVYPSGVDTIDRYTAGVVYLVDGAGQLKAAMAARLFAGKAVGMRWFNDTLVDAVTPFEVTVFP